MSAEVESMFYYGDTPWHSLGKPVEHALTAKEAIVEAGLDWEVEMVPLYHRWQGQRLKIEHKLATRRTTDGTILGIVTPKYSPVQNKEAFGFFDSVVGTGEAKYHTAGSLRQGQYIWMLAKLNDVMNINGDEVDKYMLLMNGHNGWLALKMFFTPIRVVCMNTLMAAAAGAQRIETFHAKHLGNISGKMEQAREILGMTMKFYSDFQEQANILARNQLPAPAFPKLLAASFGTTGSIRMEDIVTLNDFGSTKKINQMEMVQALYEGDGKGLDNPTIKGTKWAAYNAIVEYVDYGRKFRGASPEDNRLENAWISDGMRIKNKAWKYLTS